MILPGDEGARTASKSGGSSGPAGDWIVGGLPGEETAAVAAGAGAREVIPSAGVYSVPAARARELAASLEDRELLVYAEPNVEAKRTAFPTTDPRVPDETWLPFIINTGALTPPAVGSGSPVLGLMEQSVDSDHNDLSTGGNVQGPSLDPLLDDHGTGVAGVAVTPRTGSASSAYGRAGAPPSSPATPHARASRAPSSTPRAPAPPSST